MVGYSFRVRRKWKSGVTCPEWLQLPSSAFPDNFQVAITLPAGSFLDALEGHLTMDPESIICVSEFAPAAGGLLPMEVTCAYGRDNR